MDNTDATSWYLAQVKPGRLQLADRNLCRQGFQTFAPRQDGMRRHGQRFAAHRQPLFPGYIFIGFDPQEGRWHNINSTLGVKALVRFGPYPAPVPRDFIDSLLQRCDEDGVLRTPNAVQQGDQVRIGTGPFADFVAQVERLESNRRVQVLLEVMGREIRMDVPLSSLH